MEVYPLQYLTANTQQHQFYKWYLAKKISDSNTFYNTFYSNHCHTQQ